MEVVVGSRIGGISGLVSRNTDSVKKARGLRWAGVALAVIGAVLLTVGSCHSHYRSITLLSVGECMGGAAALVIGLSALVIADDVHKNANKHPTRRR